MSESHSTPLRAVRRSPWLALLPLVAAASGCEYPSLLDRARPNALWRIVDECIGTPGPYCACPAFERTCCGNPEMPNGAVVWAMTDDFVVIRDMRACGCDEGFVHGLALPRSRVTGIEDPRRPEAIWPFAWGVAREHIPDETQIALVLNPEDARTQNQMHVHLVRLTDAGRHLLDHPPLDSEGLRVRSIPDLGGVFAAAVAVVGDEKIGEQGVLVARASSGNGWSMLLVRGRSPEGYTRGSCRH